MSQQQPTELAVNRFLMVIITASLGLLQVIAITILINIWTSIEGLKAKVSEHESRITLAEFILWDGSPPVFRSDRNRNANRKDKNE
jgi:hypothetical protein